MPLCCMWVAAVCPCTVCGLQLCALVHTYVGCSYGIARCFHSQRFHSQFLQVWAANLDDPDGQWAPVALVEHPWGALLTKTDDTHLQVCGACVRRVHLGGWLCNDGVCCGRPCSFFPCFHICTLFHISIFPCFHICTLSIFSYSHVSIFARFPGSYVTPVMMLAVVCVGCTACLAAAIHSWYTIPILTGCGAAAHARARHPRPRNPSHTCRHCAGTVGRLPRAQESASRGVAGGAGQRLCGGGCCSCGTG